LKKKFYFVDTGQAIYHIVYTSRRRSGGDYFYRTALGAFTSGCGEALMGLQETFEKQGDTLFRGRSYFPLIAVAAGILWYAFLLRDGDRVSINPWWQDLIFLCVGLAGLGIRAFTVGFTPKGTSGRNTKEGQVAEQLNTSGIYSTVRHPLYLGNFLMYLAPVLILLDLWFTLFFCAMFCIYYERIMYAEEQFLRKKFGRAYIDWSNRTPAFIPKLSLYKKTELSFSVKNIIKREHYGFFNLIFIMTAFRVVGFGVTDRKFYLDTPWMIIFATAFVITLIVRFVKKCTNVLRVEGR
jgi:protein-S-isoprenylcysteine O-methyltransferase Ste14